MKKVLIALTAVAVALAFTVPAMADIKLTTKGQMEVKGILVKKNILNRGTTDVLQNDSTDAWYQQKLVIDPVLHINDKVRIHSRVTIMEREWAGGSGDDFDQNFQGTGADFNYRGQHNLWWERCYLSFPLWGGTIYVGRMPGGSWAYQFQDSDANRDRIKYIRMFGNIMGVVVVEKLNERDGGLFPNGGGAAIGRTLTAAPLAGDVFTQSHSDTDAYAAGVVIPFGKNINWKPLLYYIPFQSLSGYDFLILNGLMVKFGPFQFDLEANYRMRKWDNFFPGTANQDLEGKQITAWGEFSWRGGPFEAALGAYYIEGEDSQDATGANKRNSMWGMGGEYQPYYLLFSEDVGLLWNSTGVGNNSVGTSGYQSAYLRGGFKISDSMKLSGVVAILQADKMLAPAPGAATPSKDIGTEVDLTFEWKLMDNLTYVIDAAYLKAGSYWDDVDGVATADLSNDVYGFRHMLVISW
jgi:hypothetical protein